MYAVTLNTLLLLSLAKYQLEWLANQGVTTPVVEKLEVILPEAQCIDFDCFPSNFSMSVIHSFAIAAYTENETSRFVSVMCVEWEKLFSVVLHKGEAWCRSSYLGETFWEISVIKMLHLYGFWKFWGTKCISQDDPKKIMMYIRKGVFKIFTNMWWCL